MAFCPIYISKFITLFPLAFISKYSTFYKPTISPLQTLDKENLYFQICNIGRLKKKNLHYLYFREKKLLQMDVLMLSFLTILFKHCLPSDACEATAGTPHAPARSAKAVLGWGPASLPLLSVPTAYALHRVALLVHCSSHQHHLIKLKMLEWENPSRKLRPDKCKSQTTTCMDKVESLHYLIPYAQEIKLSS